MLIAELPSLVLRLVNFCVLAAFCDPCYVIAGLKCIPSLLPLFAVIHFLRVLT